MSLYSDLLLDIQKEVNENYWKLNAEQNSEKTKSIIINFYKSYLRRNNHDEELAEKLYNDTHEYSILTEPLLNPNVEGIHINSWSNVVVQMRNGKFITIDGFESPNHAIDIMRRLIQSKGSVLDEAMPIAETSIGSDIRITTVKSPIVDENIGIACYIRKLSKAVFKAEQYTNSDFATEKEIEMLSTFMRRGVSVLVVGKVNTGKTTFLSYLLSTLPSDMKIVTIENSAREMNLVSSEKKNVIHMLTRESKNQDLNIRQEDLVVISLRLNPDYISVAEMRDSEASAAVEASRSGHPVISTAHAGSPIEAHKRIADLSRKGNNTDYNTALIQAQEAFPIVVYLHMLEDNSRKIMGITEVYVDEENKAHYNTLWKYEIEENDKLKVVGKHIKVGEVSERLIDKMKMYGLSNLEIERLK